MMKTLEELSAAAREARLLSAQKDGDLSRMYVSAAEAFEDLAKRRELADYPMRAFIAVDDV
jgi:hypothetical protein